MNITMYRITRELDFEEWIIERPEMPMEERFLIIFEPKFIRAYLITPDKSAAENEEFLIEIHGLYHFHQKFREDSIEVINVDIFDKDGNIIDGTDATDAIDNVAKQYRNRLPKDD